MLHTDYSFGAQLLREPHTADHTRFRLWAPDAKAASVLLDDQAAFPLQMLEDGWYEATIQCGADTRYRFEIVMQDDSLLRVADPASRAQSGDVHDASVVVDPLAYQWLTPAWRGRPWHETVLYELHVGALGGFEGVTQKLPELAALGITAIELMPLAEFPGARNWGYDGVLPYAPDASYGTVAQLKTLVDMAHGLGMMVFLDVVYNHFGPDGNYLGAYAPSFFRHDVDTPWGQAIDFRKRAVRDFFTENALYWLREYRFDGLRLDAAHAIIDQDWLQEMATRIHREIDKETHNARHVHLVLEHDGNAAHLLADTSDAPADSSFNAQWNDDGHHVFHALLTGERDSYYVDYCERPAEKLARCLEQGFVYQGETSPFRHKPRGEVSAHLPPTAFVLFLQNHDQIGNRACGERLTTLARPSALRAAMALLLLSPQIPLLFMGEEYGATQPFLYFTDYSNPALATAVLEGRRQEFAGSAAFADPQQREKIPDPNQATTFTASIPHEGSDAAQWREWTQALLAVRQRNIMPRLQTCRALGACALSEAAVCARWQFGDGSVLAIAINLSATPLNISINAIAKTGGADLLFETEGALAGLERDILPADSMIALLEPTA